MDEMMQRDLEAAAFRRLVDHLRKRSDVQDIELMELAGFCRNCLANWYQDAAAAKVLSLRRRERSSTACLTRLGSRSSRLRSLPSRTSTLARQAEWTSTQCSKAKCK
jgi:Protein of unknown function (DUF1244)